MKKIFTTTKWYNSIYDDIIDVRSPSEYHEDHIIGSINCPVLSDLERENIGTIYKKSSSFKAKVLGSSIISKNISKIIKKFFTNKPGAWKPLVYCWRGGQRSRALCLVLNEIGWRTTQLKGGYKYYRNDITRKFDNLSSKLKLVLISGRTGTGKTKLLHEINNMGGQTIDLEKIANHKGSLLGKNINKPQPSQKFFESKLFNELNKLNYNKKIFLEAESSKIGNLHIPKSIWKIMLDAKKINIEAKLEKRIDFLVSDYKYVQTQSNFFLPLLDGLKNRIDKKIINTWKNHINNQEWKLLTKSLLENHYDPAYNANYKKKNQEIIKNYSLKKVSKIELKKVAENILSS